MLIGTRKLDGSGDSKMATNSESVRSSGAGMVGEMHTFMNTCGDVVFQ